MVVNGRVEGDFSGETDLDRDGAAAFVGTVSCDVGYNLAGNQRVKCMNGKWSTGMPVCYSELKRIYY